MPSRIFRSHSPRSTSVLEESPWMTNLHPVNWLAHMQQWQALPPEQRQAQVPASMAFEGEPVSRERLEELYRTATPASSRPTAESSATPN